MCFAWISVKKTAIISLYNINLLAFITKADSVYCTVRAGFSIQADTVWPLKG